MVGKSGNWRMDCCSFILRLESSEEEAELAGVSRNGGVSGEASCWTRLECDEVESDMLREGRRRKSGDGREYILNYLGQCGKRHGHGV